jgi:hypothetical protein
MDLIKKNLESQGMDMESAEIEFKKSLFFVTKIEYNPVQEPVKILDGADANQDIHRLIGYVWGEGNQKREFPASHMAELATFFLEKYNLK